MVTSAFWLLAGAGLALAAGLVMAGHRHAGVALTAAAVTVLGGWLLEALAGHAHKVVPFIVWSAFRVRGIDKTPAGRPLMFADLYDHHWAATVYGLVTAGIGVLGTGFAASRPAVIAAGGALLAAAGLALALNLSMTPARILARYRPAVARDTNRAAGPGRLES